MTVRLPSIVQTIRAYARAATLAQHQAAPLGDPAAPPGLADLAEQADGYARSWSAQETARLFTIGPRPAHADRPALVYIVEAARALCARNRGGAVRLLRLALAELEASPAPREVAP